MMCDELQCAQRLNTLQVLTLYYRISGRGRGRLGGGPGGGGMVGG